jgi:hypothetical protein
VITPNCPWKHYSTSRDYADEKKAAALLRFRLFLRPAFGVDCATKADSATGRGG